MSGHIPKRTLLVVSDTAMMEEDGKLLVFDPVLREMKVVEEMFDNIVWLGARTLYKKPSLKPILSNKVQTVVLPCVSRRGWLNVLYVVLAYPVILYEVLKHLKHATHVHTRGPSHPAFVAILLSLFDNKRIYAHKYAGEWTMNNIPFTYRLQRGILRRIHKPNIRITISGKNSTNSANVYDLQNPCIYEAELQGMNEIGKSKDFSNGLQLLFVGNLMPSKGIISLMQALAHDNLNNRYTGIYIVGGGKLMDEVKELAAHINKIQVTITGDISREELNQLYAKAHVLILPSNSESFPKVVAEAAAYGCIPVTTSLSAITKQITDGTNGFLMHKTNSADILQILNRVADNANLKMISTEAIAMSSLYTYERFKQHMAKVYSIGA